MSLLSRSTVRNSTAIQTVSRVRERIRTASSNARVTTILGRGRESGNTTETGLLDDRSRGPSDGEGTSTEPRDKTGTDTIEGRSESSPSVKSSAVYQLLQRGQRMLTESRIFEWLTAEPDPEVIVIDLRETRTTGWVISTLDRIRARAEQDLMPALPAATVTRGGYWVRNQLVARPLRGVGIGLAVVANAGLLTILLGSENPVTPVTLFLFAVLLLAVRAFRSDMSLDELTDTVWYRQGAAAVIAVFEPPAPPESSPEPNPGSDTTEGDSTRE